MKFIEKMSIEELKLWDENPRFNDEAAQKLTKVLKKHGFIDPVIVDENNVVRAGNTRIKAAKILGLKYVPVIIINFKDSESAIAYSIANNKANEWAKWDFLSLKEILDSMKEYGYEDVGFTKDEYENLLNYESFDPEEYFKEELEKEINAKKEREKQKIVCPYCGYEFYIEE